MKDYLSVSFVVPCYNESPNIKKTIKEIQYSIKQLQLNSYEIIIVDDGSTDTTFLVAKEIQNNHTNIKIQKHSTNIGYGGAIKTGFKVATKNYVMWVPGDDSHKGTEITKMIFKIENYDFVTTYYTNTVKRNVLRRLFTKIYTPFLNFIFNLNLPYYNGLTVYKRLILNDISIYTNSFTWQIELLLKILKTKNIKYLIVPTKLDDREIGKSKAFNLKNSIYVILSITRLYIIQFLMKKRG